MSWRVRRTPLALALTAIAVTLPCVAWYVYGSRAAGQQARRVERYPLEQAGRAASQIAQQLGRRLEALRQSESRRPFVEYVTGEGLALSDCAAEAGWGSPLAEGPVDPLIWAHFQLDEVGQLSLPTLGEPTERERPHDPDSRAIQLAIFDELECASSRQFAALRALERDGEPRRAGPGGGVVTVGPFSWHTVSIKGQPALVALREVATARAVLTQGFVVLSETVIASTPVSVGSVTVIPGEPGETTARRVPIDGDPWTVRVDAGAEADRATAEARTLLRRFRWTFAIGCAFAILAGGCVVLLVHQADRLAEQRSHFAAAAAHELRTPLAGLQLYGEMLAEGHGAPMRRTAYARRIADEAARLGRVVCNVLGFARLQRDGLAARPVPGDLRQAVSSAVERLRHGIEANGATVTLEAPENLPPVSFDDDAVHQIVQNLLDNAEKYSRAASDRSIRVRLESSERAVRLKVIDHGPGVPPALRRRLFSPFERGPDPDAPAGLGIGLAIVKALAAAQGARATHADAPGGGSCFSIDFVR